MFNPASVQALKVFQTSGMLTPNNGAAPGTLAYVNNNYIISNGTSVQPVNKFSIKGDHIFNEKHRISGYYGYDREATDCGSGWPGHAARPLHQLQRPDPPGTQMCSLQLGLDYQPDQVQPFLCRRQ